MTFSGELAYESVNTVDESFVKLGYEQFHMPYTWNVHNFKHNAPKILTI